MRAYMFINALHSQSPTLTKAIRGVPGVHAADAITGDYDVVASIEARDLAELREILAGVQAIAGVIKTTTCMVLAD
ncbi:MAG: Lrp/AsnC ligand binding domain-containing protein [Candidatus Dormiibacterota bacterium]